MNLNHPITVYASDTRGDAKNCVYPHPIPIDSDDTACAAFALDTTFARYENNYRSNKTFLSSDALPMDCDNDHSDDPADWITPEIIESVFADVPYILHFSRNHQREKNGKSVRPRFHVIFSIRETADLSEYVALKTRLQTSFPFFDPKALDGARFFFGTEDPQVIVHDGATPLDVFLDDMDSQAFDDACRRIPEGERNTTLFRRGCAIARSSGVAAEGEKAFLREAEYCDPPLPEQEVRAIWRSITRIFKKESETALQPIRWEPPIPFETFDLPPFPVEALPPALRNYALAVSESTQTAVDLSAVAILAALAICAQRRCEIVGKPDWWEPLNLYTVIILPPAERKSAVLSHVLRPLETFEQEYNDSIKEAIITSQMQKNALIKAQHMMEDKVAKGKATEEELRAKAKELAAFRELLPLKLFVDDITTEKLSSVLAQNDSRAALASAEGGLFDNLSGQYSTVVNLDVYLKAHSGDNIRVDRAGRPSETIINPALTILLAVQPSVLDGLMRNSTFRGRGLTARFLFSMPRSALGRRRFETAPIPESVKQDYASLFCKLLADRMDHAPIQLTDDAYAILETVFYDTERRLQTDLADIPDWAGKYVGAVLRIAGLLHVAENPELTDFEELSAETMQNAVQIGEYFIAHAKAAFSLMGADPVTKQCEYLLEHIRRAGLEQFSKRDAMRLCRQFKTADALQPVLNRLCEYGYLAPVPSPETRGNGRKPSDVYRTNPAVLSA